MKLIILKTHARDYSQLLYNKGDVVELSGYAADYRIKKGFAKEYKPQYKTKEEKVNLEDKTWAELVNMAKDRGIKLKSRKKDDIIKQLS